MEIDTWWTVIERARTAVGDRAADRNAPDDPLPGAVVAELATLTGAELVDWYVTLVRVTDSAYRHPCGWRLT